MCISPWPRSWNWRTSAFCSATSDRSSSSSLPSASDILTSSSRFSAWMPQAYTGVSGATSSASGLAGAAPSEASRSPVRTPSIRPSATISPAAAAPTLFAAAPNMAATPPTRLPPSVMPSFASPRHTRASDNLPLEAVL